MGTVITSKPVHVRRASGSRRPSRAHRDAPAPRKCLMCGRTFESEGAHNRICRRCKASQTYRSG